MAEIPCNCPLVNKTGKIEVEFRVNEDKMYKGENVFTSYIVYLAQGYINKTVFNREKILTNM